MEAQWTQRYVASFQAPAGGNLRVDFEELNQRALVVGLYDEEEYSKSARATYEALTAKPLVTMNASSGGFVHTFSTAGTYYITLSLKDFDSNEPWHARIRVERGWASMLHLGIAAMLGTVAAIPLTYGILRERKRRALDQAAFFDAGPRPPPAPPR